MMRLILANTLAALISMTCCVGVQAQASAAPGQAAPGQAAPGQAARPQAPFGQLTPAETQALHQVLESWQNQSKGTKTLDLSFLRFHYDAQAAPAGTPANKAEGVIRYAAPDRGLIRVDQIVFFAGMTQDNPAFKAFPDKFGEHWVCNGKQLIEFDRNAKECKIQNLPPEMQGKNIISSPLPFVFNLDAAQLLQRYWVRQTQSPTPEVILLEVWPKRAEDRSQYKMVQVALEARTFLPKALVMYAPNFDPKLAPVWDHYEFKSVKRNSIANGLKDFVTRNFIPQKPPAHWKIVQDDFTPLSQPEAQQAQGHGAAKRTIRK